MSRPILIVGAGPFGLTLARCLTDAGRAVRVIEKRPIIGGNATDHTESGLLIHNVGIHIMHTSNETLWTFLHRFSEWTPFEFRVWNQTLCGILPMPFTLDFYHRFYGVSTPREMEALLGRFRQESQGDDLKSWAISQVGTQAFDLLVEAYTEKQWGRPCQELPSSILKRLDIRCSWDTRYFSDRFQGVPRHGYTRFWEAMSQGIDVQTKADFLTDRTYWEGRADQIVFTGPLDHLWDQMYGPLEYRSLRFEHEARTGPVQGCLMLNSSLREEPWTRTYEWAYLPPNTTPTSQSVSIITREYPLPYAPGVDPLYPVRTEEMVARAQRYRTYTAQTGRYHVGGRLGTFRYYDMHQAMTSALSCAARLLQGKPMEELDA